MDSQRITQMIVKAYGKKYNLVERAGPSTSRVQYYWDQLVERVPQISNYRYQFAGAAAGVLLLVVTIYYFNMLVTAEHAWLRSAGQVEVYMQRRNDISVNLANAVQGYSSYERNVLSEVVRLRGLIRPDDLKSGKLEDILKGLKQNSAAAPTGKEGAALLGGISGLFAVAEQYPDLKLSANFQSLMTALIEVEKDLALERVKFNEAVFGYAEMTTKFPSRYFASAFGFRAPDYFKATNDAQALKPVQF